MRWHLQPTADVRWSSTAPAMAAPSEVDVPRPSSSSATCTAHTCSHVSPCVYHNTSTCLHLYPT